MKRRSIEHLRKLTRREALGMLGATGAAFSLARCGDSPTRPSSIVEAGGARGDDHGRRPAGRKSAREASS